MGVALVSYAICTIPGSYKQCCHLLSANYVPGIVLCKCFTSVFPEAHSEGIISTLQIRELRLKTCLRSLHGLCGGASNLYSSPRLGEMEGASEPGSGPSGKRGGQ